MDIAPDIDAFLRFVLLVFPGMVAMRVYRLLKSARDLDWQNAIVEAVFFSVVNFAVCLPVITLIGSDGFSKTHPVAFSFCFMAIILIAPMLLAVAYARLQSTWLMRGLMLQHTTASDYFFDKKLPCFILVHLKDGKCVLGYFGCDSFAGSAPRHGDLYLQHVFAYDRKSRTIGSAIDDSAGMLVRAEDYSLLEFFYPPTSSQETTHDQRTATCLPATTTTGAECSDLHPDRLSAGRGESRRTPADEPGPPAATATASPA